MKNPTVSPPRVPESFEATHGHSPKLEEALEALFSGGKVTTAWKRPGELSLRLTRDPALVELVRARINAHRLEAEVRAIVGINQKLMKPDELSGRDLAELYRSVKPKEDSAGPSFTFVFPTTVREEPNV